MQAYYNYFSPGKKKYFYVIVVYINIFINFVSE